MYIVLKVNHTDNNLCKKGQGYFNFSQAIDNNRLGKDITSNMIDKCIRWLKRTEQIITKKSTRGMYITVVNYNKFCVVDQVNQIEEKVIKDGIETESKQNQNDTIHNNDKNGKNININTGINPDIDNHNFKRGQGIESLRDMVNKIKIKDVDPDLDATRTSQIMERFAVLNYLLLQLSIRNRTEISQSLSLFRSRELNPIQPDYKSDMHHTPPRIEPVL